jgi:glycogen(starch) synthase
VHVRNAHRLMKRTGQKSSVLNIDPRAPESDDYIRVSGALGLFWELLRHARNDWTLNVHTNGHNWKSWAIALACGVAGQFGPGATLTLHSGMTPAYIRNTRESMRRVMWFVCVMYRKVICVNGEIAQALGNLGVPNEQIQVTPAFLPVDAPQAAAPPEIEAWMRKHSPVVSATMFFRPEYGFDLLIQAIGRLREQHPKIGCLIMGDCDNAAKRQSSDAVLLTGDLDHDMCLSLIARSKVFVRPTFKDGDSISVREAAALGVPVVASNVGTRPPGVLLFEAGDAQGLTAGIQRVLSMEA